MNQEKWVDEILKSFDGMNRAEMPKLFSEKLAQNVTQSKRKPVALPLPKLLLAAAGIAFLVTANIGALVMYDQNNKLHPGPTETNPLVSEYFNNAVIL